MSKQYTKFDWVDEVLGGPARYDILEDGGGAFKSLMQIILATSVSTPGSAVNASRLNNIETGVDAIDSYLHETATEKTVSGGVLTVDKSRHKVQPQSGTADDIDTITGMPADSMLILYASDPGTDTLTLKHNTGNIRCFGGVDIQLSHGFAIGYSNGTIVMVAGGGGSSSSVSGPQSFGDNYVFSTSISSNNLQLNLRTAASDGVSEPSASDKVSVRIGNTRREIVAALNLTVNAGSSVFNAGSAELLGKPVQLFVYFGYRVASSTVFMLLSRIPYARTYADFSTTATNEKYGAYTGSAPASTDEVENVGRITVQNSGTASFNWSIPSGAYVVNRPIYETDWLEYTPTITSTGGAYTTISVSANYKISYSSVEDLFSVTVTNKGTATGNMNVSLPFTTTGIGAGTGREDGVTGKALAAAVANASTTAQVSLADGVTVWVNSYIVDGLVKFRIK